MILKPAMTSLVPQLQAMFPFAVFALSDWGLYYDDILNNPAPYGITNTTQACLGNAACTNPDTYFYYFSAHPSARSHKIVGDKLFAEVQAILEPMPLVLVGAGLIGLFLTRRRRRA